MRQRFRIKEALPYLALVFLLFLLLLKNPFSGLNIISDLEPLPDTIHYLTPVKSFLEGTGFKITYQNRKLNPVVPPLYSFLVLPSYNLFNDPRAFYFANLVLVFISAALFLKIVQRLIKNKSIKVLLFLAFVTDQVIFWYPSIAMAENLLLCTFLLSIWLILKPVNLKILISLGLLSSALYATKYAAITLTLSLILVALFKIYFLKDNTFKRKIYLYGALILSVLIGLTLLSVVELLNTGSYSLRAVRDSLPGLSISQPSLGELDQNPTGRYSSTFSLVYIRDNLVRYFFGLLGGEISIAGKQISIIPVILGFFALGGLLANLFISKFKLVNLYFFLSVFGTLTFLSYYYATDGRYLFALVPILIISAGIFLDQITNFFFIKKRAFYCYLIILICFTGVIIQVYQPVLNQLKTNFFIPQPSLNYQTVQVFNNYFSSAQFDQRPAVISTLPPYLIDFYSNKNYDLLPLSGFQYFSNTPFETWGIPKGKAFLDYYEDRLKDGSPVFVSDYRTMGFFYFQDFKKIRERFNLTEVASGCSDQCKLYQLKIKDRY